MFVTYILQKLSNVERDVTLIIIHFWQLFSQYLAKRIPIPSHRLVCPELVQGLQCKSRVVACPPLNRREEVLVVQLSERPQL